MIFHLLLFPLHIIVFDVRYELRHGVNMTGVVEGGDPAVDKGLWFQEKTGDPAYRIYFHIRPRYYKAPSSIAADRRQHNHCKAIE